MHYSYGLGHVMGAGYGFVWMLFWAAVVIGIGAVLGWWFAHAYRRAQPHHESPLEILKLRYAHGEIDDEEYRKHLDQLRR